MSKELAKKLLLFLLGVLVLSFIIWSGFYQKDITFPKGQAEKVISLSIGHKPIKAYVADTPLSQERGLSGRQSIGSDQAMLFAFAAPARYGIWMKDMKFAIDILWLRETRIEADKDMRINADEKHSLVVVDMKERVSPATYPEIFTPQSSALYVLEARAGFARENNLKIGSEISFSQSN